MGRLCRGVLVMRDEVLFEDLGFFFFFFSFRGALWLC